MKVAIVGASGAVGQESAVVRLNQKCRTKIHFSRKRNRSKTAAAQR